VLRSRTGRVVPFRVLVDGEAPGTAHGLDVDEEGRGTLVQPNWDEVLLTYIFRWGVQTRCWEDD
jgi:hypothetical protein